MLSIVIQLRLKLNISLVMKMKLVRSEISPMNNSGKK